MSEQLNDIIIQEGQNLVQTAIDNGHAMIRVSPDRYECMHCPATITKDTKHLLRKSFLVSWKTHKINTLCPEALAVPFLSVVGQPVTGKATLPESVWNRFLGSGHDST